MTVITNIEDLRVLAQKRVPRMFYDYADSGSWTEGTYRAVTWGGTAALLLYLVHGMFDSPYWKNDLSVEFWLLAAFLMIGTRSAKAVVSVGSALSASWKSVSSFGKADQSSQRARSGITRSA